MADEHDQEFFFTHLRKALQHLYDPGELRHNPLQNQLGIEPGVDRAAALRKILQDAIQGLKPDEKTPLESNAWRIYDVLSFRFLEQSSQKEVASDLSISTRQLQRLETIALQVLGDYLVAHYNLSLDTHTHEPQPGSNSAYDPQAPSESGLNEMFEQELDWLRKSGQNEEIEIDILIETAVKTVSALFQKMNCLIQVEVDSDLPLAVGQITPFRQALINLLTAAAQMAQNGRVDVSAVSRDQQICLRIAAVPASPIDLLGTYSVDEFTSVARQLVELSGGVLDLPQSNAGSAGFEAHLMLPAVQHKLVLVIDDNADTLLLIERYLSGGRYQFAGGRDPRQALSLAETLHPQAIVLDVMLPGIDGWDLLGQLKVNSPTQKIPVIISTILPQESLALTLGADGFLQKPFTQAQFLAVLDHQTSQPVTE